MIFQKPVAKEDGQAARVKKPTAGFLIDTYPTVAKQGDGTLIDLACLECKGNAKQIRGTRGSIPSKLEYLEGVKGLLRHLSQSRYQGESEKWVFDNRGM